MKCVHICRGFTLLILCRISRKWNMGRMFVPSNWAIKITDLLSKCRKRFLSTHSSHLLESRRCTWQPKAHRMFSIYVTRTICIEMYFKSLFCTVRIYVWSLTNHYLFWRLLLTYAVHNSTANVEHVEIGFELCQNYKFIRHVHHASCIVHVHFIGFVNL